MKVKHIFSSLSKFEWGLWSLSSLAVILSHLLSPDGDILSLIASLIGAAALIFVAKGHVIGQLLTIVFAICYGIISYHFRYYGEMITYLCMSLPMAILATISWIKHPYRDTEEVEVSTLSPRKVILLFIAAVGVTVAFYFILDALNTASLLVSTLSITTSFVAASFTYLRSPYYALAYAANDIVLIVLWITAAVTKPSYFSMVMCFVMFFANDIYGFLNWKRMKKRQEKNCCNKKGIL